MLLSTVCVIHHRFICIGSCFGGACAREFQGGHGRPAGHRPRGAAAVAAAGGRRAPPARPAHRDPVTQRERVRAPIPVWSVARTARPERPGSLLSFSGWQPQHPSRARSAWAWIGWSLRQIMSGQSGKTLWGRAPRTYLAAAASAPPGHLPVPGG